MVAGVCAGCRHCDDKKEASRSKYSSILLGLLSLSSVFFCCVLRVGFTALIQFGWDIHLTADIYNIFFVYVDRRRPMKKIERKFFVRSWNKLKFNLKPKWIQKSWDFFFACLVSRASGSLFGQFGVEKMNLPISSFHSDDGSDLSREWNLILYKSADIQLVRIPCTWGLKMNNFRFPYNVFITSRRGFQVFHVHPRRKSGKKRAEKLQHVTKYGFLVGSLLHLPSEPKL